MIIDLRTIKRTNEENGYKYHKVNDIWDDNNLTEI
jgi:hypothetical protein